MYFYLDSELSKSCRWRQQSRQNNALISVSCEIFHICSIKRFYNIDWIIFFSRSMKFCDLQGDEKLVHSLPTIALFKVTALAKITYWTIFLLVRQWWIFRKYNTKYWYLAFIFYDATAQIGFRRQAPYCFLIWGLSSSTIFFDIMS
jgi:hypothetical protein